MAMISGTILSYSDAEGWGVATCELGEVFVHFSAIEPHDRGLAPGDHVTLQAEAAQQDGYTWRATTVRRQGMGPATPPSALPGATSTLSVAWDDEDDSR